MDPKNPDRLYSLNTYSAISEDAGKTFTPLSTTHRHVDDHALWINPKNTRHLIMGGDGGIYASWDRGQTWRHVDNLPITQFYRVQPDNAEPFYNVCGGTQDNNSLCAPSRTQVVHGIANADWTIILGGDGYKSQSDPRDPNLIYTQYQYGGLARYDRRTQERLYITPKPPSGVAKYKWNWNTPLLISPHNADRIYYAAEYVFRSDDRGDSWQIISPDLTRQIDRNALEVMGRVWSVDAIAKNDSTSIYGNIVGLSESPVQANVLYAGTDDGVISVSTDGGENWRSNRRFRGVPDMSLVEDLIASSHDANRAYAVFDNHKRGDFKPYVYRTDDQGRSWRSIIGNLPDRGSVHTIAEDPVDPNLLFVGTEFGLYFSQDGGKRWHELTQLPTIAVRDIEIQAREQDLVIGTFGRGVYILDDYQALRSNTAAITESPATLFPTRDAWLYVEGDRWGPNGGSRSFQGDNFYVASNPPYGAAFTYYLPEGFDSLKAKRRADERKREEKGQDTPYPDWEALRQEDTEREPSLVLEIRDPQGEVVRRVEAPHGKGLHRIAWDMRLPAPDPARLEEPPPQLFAIPPAGPMALPGEYQAQLIARIDGQPSAVGSAQAFRLKSLENSPEITQDRPALLAFQRKTGTLLSAVTGAVRFAEQLKGRIDHLWKGLDATSSAAASDYATLGQLKQQLDSVNQALLGDRTLSGRNEPAPMSISERTLGLRGDSWRSQAPVTGLHQASYEIAAEEFGAVMAGLRSLQKDLSAFETRLGTQGTPWTPGRLPEWPGTDP